MKWTESALRTGLRMEGLTPVEAAMVAFLHRAKVWVSAERLNAQTADASHLYDHAAPIRHPNNVTVHVAALRKRFGDDVILNKWGVGYTLGAPGVQLCQRALAALPLESAA